MLLFLQIRTSTVFPATFFTSTFYEHVALWTINRSPNNNCFFVILLTASPKVNHSYGHSKPHSTYYSWQWRLQIKFMGWKEDDWCQLIKRWRCQSSPWRPLNSRLLQEKNNTKQTGQNEHEQLLCNLTVHVSKTHYVLKSGGHIKRKPNQTRRWHTANWMSIVIR